jgi:hypothetical protein
MAESPSSFHGNAHIKNCIAFEQCKKVSIGQRHAWHNIICLSPGEYVVQSNESYPVIEIHLNKKK